MAAYGTIQELKNAINDSIYANDAGLLTAEILQERLHDIIDTLEVLVGSGEGDISALESANNLAQIYAGADKVATEAWVGEQTFISAAEKGANNGIAELDENGKVAASQLNYDIDLEVIGDRAYAENNLITDSETITESLDKLDKAVILKTKVIEIGDWNMDSTSGVNVAHNITLFDNIRKVSAIIRGDSGSFQNYDFFQGGTIIITLTDIALERTDSGIFDSMAFDETSYNRGWIIIQYTA
jgi:hypothetical protein